MFRSCAFCGQPPDCGVNLGPMLGPIRDIKSGSDEDLYVHRLCALWSPKVSETDHGTLKNVLAEIKRGRQLKCTQCGRRGASLGCRVERCACSYHIACAQQAGCTYYCDIFQVACPSHARHFAKEVARQNRPHPFTPYRHVSAPSTDGRSPLEPRAPEGLFGPGAGAGGGAAAAAAAGGGDRGGLGANKGAAAVEDPFSPPVELPDFIARKRGQQGAAARQHILAAREALKRARRELERKRRRGAVEPESSDDDEHFQKKERRRLARDTGKLNPITLNGDGTAVQHVYIASPPIQKGGLGHGRGAHEQRQMQQPVVETAVLGSIAATDFSSVAGLDDVVRQLREMVLLPMQYPGLFESLGLHPPRGILFHGVPGTGKTLVARALAGACAKHSPTPVTFFARKGADCLGKFHGEAERTLRLLFEEASRRAPALIFLDELDALVPARAARAGGSDQIYASVVSTLLSLMDGVTDRGAVIVIGATNRPEAIDPALRRPGRFDREVYFGLPTPAQRLSILGVHTQRWSCPPPAALLQHVAAEAEGYAGADLAALCTAAVMAAVRRSSPALLEQAGAEAAADAVAAATAIAAGSGAGLSQQQQEEQQRLCKQRRAAVLDDVEVLERDWQEALAAAPPPCSRRQGMAALVAEVAAPLPAPALPLLDQPLAALLSALDAADLPLPQPAAAAAALASAACRAGHSSEEMAALQAVLQQYGALLAPGGSTPDAAGERLLLSGEGELQPTLQKKQEHFEQDLGRTYPPCRLLLWGGGERGQEAAAGAVLKLLEGCPVHVVSLPSLVVQGGGCPRKGCVSLIGEALRRSSPRQPCVFYLPRLESWALIQRHMQPEELLDSGSGAWVERQPGGSADGAAAAAAGAVGCGSQEPGSAGRGITQASPSVVNRAAASPVGTSPHLPGFKVVSSPFSGLLPLEDRGTSQTPSAAPALRPSAQRHQQQHKPAGLGEGGEEGEGEVVEVEVTMLSGAWNVFDSLLRQVPATQPTIVLATCHSEPESTPPNLVQFFAGPEAPARPTAAAAQPGRPQHAAAPGVVLVPAAPSAAAWREAAAATAEQVSLRVASQAALQLHQHLAAAAVAAADEEGAGGGGAASGVASGSAAADAANAPRQRRSARHQGLNLQQQQQQQQQQQLLTHQMPGQQPVDPSQQREPQYNTVEMEQGLRLFSQLMRWQTDLAAELAKVRRPSMATIDRWLQEQQEQLAAGQQQRRHRRGSGGERDRPGNAAGAGGGPPHGAFALLAERCKCAGYDSVDAVLADASAAASAVSAAAAAAMAAAEAGPPGSDGSSGSRLECACAVSGACALRDLVEERCFELRQALALGDSAAGSARLLAAAAARIRGMQREQQAQQQAEAAAQRQAERLQQRVRQREEEEEEKELLIEDAGEDGEPGGTLEPAEEEAQQVEQDQSAAVAEGDETPSEAQREQHRQQQKGGEQMPPSDAAAAGGAEAAAAADAQLVLHRPLEEAAEEEAVDAAMDAATALHRQLSHLLLGELQQRLLPVPASGQAAWHALTEWGAMASTAAAAACTALVAAAVSAGEATGGDGEALGMSLAARCAAACAAAFP